MSEHGHPRFLLHPRDQALAAARHDQVDIFGRLQQRAHRGPIGRGHQLHHVGRQARRDDPLQHSGVDGAVALLRLAAPAQDHRIARAQAERGRIRRHIGPAFVDDADHAQGHPHSRQLQPVGADLRVDHAAQRIGERGDLLHPGRRAGDPVLVQLQPIEHRCRQAVGRGILHVARIGGDDRRRLVPQRLGRAAQRIGLLRVACLRDRRRGAPRPRAHRRDQHFGGLRQVVHRASRHPVGRRLSMKEGEAKGRRPDHGSHMIRLPTDSEAVPSTHLRDTPPRRIPQRR